MAVTQQDNPVKAPGIDLSKLAATYLSLYGSMESEQAPFIYIWQDIRNFIAPRTARFKGEEVNNSATRQDLYMINCSPRFAVRTLSAGLQSGVTSPARPWFKLGVPDPALNKFPAVKMWLDEIEKRMRTVFSRSNLYDRLKSNYAILGTYGTSGFGIDEDDQDVIRAYDFPMGTFKFATSAAGRVNTVLRDVSMTAINIVEKFGRGRHSQADNACDTSNYNTRFPVCQIIEPNRSYKPGSAMTFNKGFASVFMDRSKSGAESILSYKGYDEQPVMGPRWDVLGEDIYGFGCGELALGDSKQTQLMEKRKLQKLDKNVNPPMIADSSMRSQRTENVPGGTTYVNGLITGKPGYGPAYMLDGAIEQMVEEIMRVEGRIDEAFFKNLFLAVSEIGDQPNITATQINMLREEKLLMLGPVLERLDDELLDLIISRTFNIMYRRGMFPPPPKEIQGMPLRVEYVSILAQAQKAIGVGNTERYVGFIGEIAQLQLAAQQQPDIYDKVNFDNVADVYGDGIGVDPSIIRGDDEVLQIRQDRAKKTAVQQAMQATSAGAETASTMANTPTDSDNLLTRVMGIQGAGAR